MKSIFLFSFLTFWALTSFGQTVIDGSKTQKISKEGMELTLFEGKPFTGFITESYPNGKSKTWITMKDGLANGQWQEWLENGQLRYNAYWLNGKGHGLWQYFHENGRLKYEESYIMDLPNGISRAYYDNGQLKDDFFWLQGQKQGVWTSYSETGVVLKTEIYDDNKLVSTTDR
ncbi:MAG: toxin-antitoxin system YwqK family antitoxin [Lewinella sp.]|nr:toxin-antitoxin system YwqK family antitoxin [Lewinella sp.]